jgi:NTE family protein
MKKETKNVALVLSGGGARGLAHIGVIEELVKRGYNITSIAGTSIGSVIGGVYAVGKMDEYKEWVTNLSKLDVFKLMDFAVTKGGLIKGEKIFREMGKIIGNAKIEELAIPFAAIAVDIENHKEVVFTSGSLTDAIRASVAIPTVITPVKYKNTYLVDGGVLAPLPLDYVKRSGNDILVAVNLNADLPYRRSKKNKPSEKEEKNYKKTIDYINKHWSKFFKTTKEKHAGYFDLMNKSLYAMQIRLTEIAIKQNKPDILIPISRRSCEIFEFYRSEEMIEYGRRQAVKMLKEFTVPVSPHRT